MDKEPSKLPPEIQKACKVLELAENELTTAKITNAWKAAMLKDYPEKLDAAVISNIAKDTLLRWIQRFD